MKIAYCDFNHDDFFENYSITPDSYGGGRIFASVAKEKIADFHIFSNEKSFQTLSPSESKANCHPLTSEQRAKLRANVPVTEVIENAGDFDLFVHHHVNWNINLTGLPKAKECCWAVSVGEICHPNNKNILLYNIHQNLRCHNRPNLYKVVIGLPLPEFQEYKKGDYIFQCTRHTPMFNTIEIAKFCRKYGIQGYFAGPIDKDYPLFDYIDNKDTHYLGVISHEDKVNYLKNARMTTYLHSWPTPFSLSAIESLAYGTPILASSNGFWSSLIEHNKNGWLIEGVNQTLGVVDKDYSEIILKAYELSANVNQRFCYESMSPYSEMNMIDSFYNAFIEIYNK